MSDALDQYLRVKSGRPRRRKEPKKYWWKVSLYNNGKIVEECRQRAATRVLAKERAAQQWGVSTISTTTAVKDKDWIKDWGKKCNLD
jgi:hypothetical protein